MTSYMEYLVSGLFSNSWNIVCLCATFQYDIRPALWTRFDMICWATGKGLRAFFVDAPQIYIRAGDSFLSLITRRIGQLVSCFLLVLSAWAVGAPEFVGYPPHSRVGSAVCRLSGVNCWFKRRWSSWHLRSRNSWLLRGLYLDIEACVASCRWQVLSAADDNVPPAGVPGAAVHSDRWKMPAGGRMCKGDILTCTPKWLLWPSDLLSHKEFLGT